MLDKQTKSKREILTDRIRPWMWKKGQSGNPAGRKKGKTMKEYARELLAKQTEEERQAFLHGLDKEIVWKMAEGNPKETKDLEVTFEKPLVDLRVVRNNNSTREDNKPKQEN